VLIIGGKFSKDERFYFDAAGGGLVDDVCNANFLDFSRLSS
jgi:hypothetical protein